MFRECSAWGGSCLVGAREAKSYFHSSTKGEINLGSFLFCSAPVLYLTILSHTELLVRNQGCVLFEGPETRY